MKKLTPVSRILIALSSLLMISAYHVPLWQILMWAPQYPEGLGMKIWIDNITGDVRIISALNHYIGMKHIEVSMFPEFTYMIYIVGAIIGFGLITALVNRRFMLYAYASLILAAGIGALIDFYMWGYDYGHNLDPTAPIVVPGMSYQPPLIGTKQLLNFTAYSGPDSGGWIFLVAGLLAVGTLVFEIRKSKKEVSAPSHPAPLAITVLLLISGSLVSCSTEPQPLVYGKDACDACRMTLMDKKFGCEIVTTKGKVYKFDDVNCLLNYIDQQQMKEQDLAAVLVVDFSSPEKLINAKDALYVKSEEIKSPMASNIASFEKKETVNSFNTEWNGKELNWSNLQKEFK